MSKDKISDYSATANSNTDIAGINIDEGCAPSGINNAIRTLMKQLKDWQSGSQDVYITPAGSAAAPAVTTTGDTNTGILFPAADTVAVSTGGTERARIDSSGSLGIGETSPSSYGKLTVTDASGGNIALRYAGNSGYAKLSTNSANELIFGVHVGGAEKMRLDQSGNLGIGVTPSTWSVGKVVEVGTIGNAVWTTNVNGLNLISNGYYNGGYKYSQSNYATMYACGAGSGSHQWFIAPSGTAGNAITFTQAMTLDASGNLGIGNTSPTYRIDVSSGDIRLANSDPALRFRNGDSEEMYIQLLKAANGGRALRIFDSAAGAERMRIDSSGNLLVGKTSTSYAVQGISLRGDNAGVMSTVTGDSCLTLNRLSSTGTIALFAKDTTTVGTISVTASATAYNTSSDYRLKENVQPMQNALATVAQLNPVTYNWKADGSDGQGFIAHELQSVVPDCVTGEKDAVDAEGNPVYQGIDTSFLVATLTAAIQELKAEFDAYKAAHP